MSRVRLVPIALIVIVSLGILFGIWRLYLQFSLINPLVSGINAVPGVLNATVVSENPPKIRVLLRPNYDLQTAYQAIQSRIDDSGNSSITFVVAGSSDAVLMPVLESMQPSIQQGEARGEFINMVADAEQQAHHLGATARITMDDHNIYIQIAKGHHDLYLVSPRVFPYTLH